jgi:hypothetical protein
MAWRARRGISVFCRGGVSSWYASDGSRGRGGIGGAYHELADAPRSAPSPRATDPAGPGIARFPRCRPRRP